MEGIVVVDVQVEGGDFCFVDVDIWCVWFGYGLYVIGCQQVDQVLFDLVDQFVYVQFQVVDIEQQVGD